MGANWNILKPKNLISNAPTLLIKQEIETSSYTIYLSDMVHIWTEQLTAKDIRRRALNSDTSIDPSEDQEQMRQFLLCVDDSLSQKPGTSLELDYRLSTEHILLKTCTPLPGDLQPLKWLVELKMDNPFILTRELIFPLLHRRALQHTELASLSQQLKEKDIILDKLIDTLAADGTFLTKVFPGAAPSKSALQSNPRQALSKHVRGLTKFDEHQWRSELSSSATQTPFHLENLFNSASLPTLSDIPQTSSLLDYDKWWLHINEETIKPASLPKPSFPTEQSQPSTGEDSQFQRQPTPPSKPPISSPNIHPPRPTPPTNPLSDGSTTTDDDDDDDDGNDNEANTTAGKETHTHSPPPAPSTNPPPLPKKLGKIGGRPPAPAPGPTHDPPPPATRDRNQDQGQTQAQQTSPDPRPRTTSSTAKAAAPAPALAQTDDPPPADQPALQLSPAEAERERADRKRVAVKRELEAKAQARAGGGAKRGRRF